MCIYCLLLPQELDLEGSSDEVRRLPGYVCSVKMTTCACSWGTVLLLPQELDLEGSNEEIGRQLCALMTTLADMHWAHVDSVQKQHQILQFVGNSLLNLAHPLLTAGWPAEGHCTHLFCG